MDFALLLCLLSVMDLGSSSPVLQNDKSEVLDGNDSEEMEKEISSESQEASNINSLDPPKSEHNEGDDSLPTKLSPIEEEASEVSHDNKDPISTKNIEKEREYLLKISIDDLYNWDFRKGEIFKIVEIHNGQITIMPVRELLYEGSSDGISKIWQKDESKDIRHDTEETILTTTAEKEPNHYIVYSNGKTWHFSEINRNYLKKFGGHTAPAPIMSRVLPEEVRIYTGSSDRTIRSWSIENGNFFTKVSDPAEGGEIFALLSLSSN